MSDKEVMTGRSRKSKIPKVMDSFSDMELNSRPRVGLAWTILWDLRSTLNALARPIIDDRRLL